MVDTTDFFVGKNADRQTRSDSDLLSPFLTQKSPQIKAEKSSGTTPPQVVEPGVQHSIGQPQSPIVPASSPLESGGTKNGAQPPMETGGTKNSARPPMETGGAKNGAQPPMETTGPKAEVKTQGSPGNDGQVGFRAPKSQPVAEAKNAGLPHVTISTRDAGGMPLPVVHIVNPDGTGNGPPATEKREAT